MSLARTSSRRGLVFVFGAVLIGTTGCSIAGGMLGGREKCWPEDEHRAASLWRGILRVDARGGRLETPEGDVIPLAPGAITFRVTATGGELLRGPDVVANGGDDVSLFGGAGADGALVMCAVEENRSS